MEPKHVVSFSGGASSFVAAHRVIERYGRTGVVLLFADTMMEDEDLYRFMNDASALLGLPITRIADGRTPWDVFRDERFLGNTRIDPCSRILKRQLLDRWIRDNAPDAIRYVGLDCYEEHRLDRLRKANASVTWEAPLMWDPPLDRGMAHERTAALGLTLPRLYAMGFAHNNCGGFCVKAGQASFARLLQVMPERYAYHESKEQEMRGLLGDVAILRDRRGGKTLPLPLSELRRRINADDFDRFDFGGCGCAVE